mgnify:CR=1 FL=1
MKITIGQRILCRLAGGDELTEQVIAGFEGGAVRLESGRMIRASWIFAAVTT